MSLTHARIDGRPLSWPAPAPLPCAALGPLLHQPFDLPPGDPRLPALHRGGPAPAPPWDNLVGAVRAWGEYPDWMDFLRPDAPNHAEKTLERALYLHHWAPWIGAPGRALDLGGGIGRFTQPLVRAGWTVDLVDADLHALRCAPAHCLDAPGRLDLHWTTAEHLPAGDDYDLVVAAELLCYVEDPASILRAILTRLRPGGVLLGSVEARYGWALAPDVAPGTLPALLAGGVVHVPGDRWVQTYDEQGLRALLGDFAVRTMLPTHYLPSGPFSAAAGALSLDEVLRQEAALREDPVLRPLHRAWTFVAQR